MFENGFDVRYYHPFQLNSKPPGSIVLLRICWGKRTEPANPELSKLLKKHLTAQARISSG
jgi:hypothetical protein